MDRISLSVTIFELEDSLIYPNNAHRGYIISFTGILMYFLPFSVEWLEKLIQIRSPGGGVKILMYALFQELERQRGIATSTYCQYAVQRLENCEAVVQHLHSVIENSNREDVDRSFLSRYSERFCY